MPPHNNIKFVLFFLLTIVLSSCTYDDGYRIEGNKVVYEKHWNTGHGTQIYGVDADPETFEVLGNNNMLWAKDKNNVYLRGGKLDFLNPQNFVVLTDLFGKDNKTVACDYKPITEANAATFKVKEFVDQTGKKVVLGVDKSAAYKCYDGVYTYMPVDSIESLELLYDIFYKDMNHVYWWGGELPLNVNQLKLLDGRYIADDKQVFYADRLVIGADVNSFQVISERRAKDKNHNYHSAKKVE